MGVDQSGRAALVVEDDDDVRRVMVEQLLNIGFSVLEAESGDEAIRMLGQREFVDLVVSDVVMPGTGGIEVGREARRTFPSAGIVLATGFSTEAGALKDFVVLKKPWDEADLVAAVQAAFAVSRAPAPGRERRLEC